MMREPTVRNVGGGWSLFGVSCSWGMDMVVVWDEGYVRQDCHARQDRGEVMSVGCCGKVS